ncbi:MAG TPA: nitroreductase family protein [Chloroflexota bacterium]|nr:nitroreductase family protein [Chloroflexota bacterium]
MEFLRVVRRRRMVRNFDGRPIPPGLRDRLVANALRGPSAGFTQGVELLVLEGAEQLGRFWGAVSPDRGFAQRGWPGVYRATLVIVPFAHEAAYLDRYAEPDKGWADRDPARWPVPYWYVDAAFAAMLVLLTAVDLGLGGLFFGVRDAAELRTAFGVPDGFEPIGAIALGYPAPDRPSSSLRRGRRPPTEVVHHGRW